MLTQALLGLGGSWAAVVAVEAVAAAGLLGLGGGWVAVETVAAGALVAVGEDLVGLAATAVEPGVVRGRRTRDILIANLCDYVYRLRVAKLLRECPILASC